jgi:hypothetical protein
LSPTVRTTPIAVPETPNTYTLVLPPGWIRVSLSGSPEDAVKDIADRMFRRLPRDAYLERRREMEDLLRGMVQQARSTGGLDLYLPVEEMHGIAVSASFVVGGVAVPQAADGLGSIAILGDLAETGELADVGGAPGVRSERVEFADPARGAYVDTRRVDYAVAVPGDDRRWLTVSFSTPGGGDPGDSIAEALVQLFDAIMTTFRWRNR